MSFSSKSKQPTLKIQHTNKTHMSEKVLDSDTTHKVALRNFISPKQTAQRGALMSASGVERSTVGGFMNCYTY